LSQSNRPTIPTDNSSNAWIEKLLVFLPTLYPTTFSDHPEDRAKEQTHVHLTSDEAIATALGATEELSEQQKAKLVNWLQERARADADRLGDFLTNYVVHLQALGCTLDDVGPYLHAERQTLASLHFLARGGVPSPTEMRRLALRLVLDARRSVDGNLDRFSLERASDSWQVRLRSSLAERLLSPVVKGKGHRVWNPTTNAVLDCIAVDSPKLSRLLEIIERTFGGPPSISDTLEAAVQPEVTFAIEESSTRPIVKLWINDREVPLPAKVKDVHELLKHLCLHPKERVAGRELQKHQKISNASKAAKKIREALDQTHPGAAQWLQTISFLGWTDNHAPSRRPKSVKDSAR
jgi:hypothetical protein